MKGANKMGFFDRVRGTVEEAGKNITTVASDNIEIVKCNSAIRACDAKIREIYTEIGERYYKSDEDVTKEEFSDLFKKIQNQENEKDGLKKKLQDLKGVEICSSCGREVSRGSKFCEWCGFPVEAKKASNSRMVCPKCHAALNGNEIFCGECGTKIEWPEEDDEKAMEDTYSPCICSTCGEELKETDAFCPNCGSPVEKKQEETIVESEQDIEQVESPSDEPERVVVEQEEDVEDTEEILTCPVCGEELKDTDVFCKNCGNPVNK